MEPKDAPHRPERVETDDSLRAERDQTDDQLGRRNAQVGTGAEEVVALARERAEALLGAARAGADAVRQRADGQAEVPGRISVARASEDAAVSDARTSADEQLEEERVRQKRAAALLLSIEREETDDRLVTERSRADHAVASRDDFLAIVSHDVRGLLSGMAMSAELLTTMPAPEAQREGERIRRLTGRMNRLIGDLLDVVSMESGKLSVRVVEQDARRLLTETLESFEHVAATRQVQITATLPVGELRAAFDHDRLLQVLTNLVGNAVKFTPPGGKVVLEVAPADGALRFSVADTGCGIAPELLDTVFDRFSQASQNDRRGLGLGLYIARCIIDAHGGEIGVASVPGHGSTFHFTVPAPGAVA